MDSSPTTPAPPPRVRVTTGDLEFAESGGSWQPPPDNLWSQVQAFSTEAGQQARHAYEAAHQLLSDLKQEAILPR